MQKTLIILFTGLIQLSGFSQALNKSIKISNDIELIKVSDNAFLHVSYFETQNYGRVGANGLIFINGNKAFLFDSPWNNFLTQELVSWLTDSMKLEIAGFIPNHWHDDCMGGLDYLQSQKIKSYASKITIDIAKSKNLPIPDHGFMDSLQLQLDDKLVNCYYFGVAHSMDNIVIWIPSEQILFAGCMIKSSNSKDLGNTTDGDMIGYPKTVDKLFERFPEAKIVIPGHGHFGGFELINHTKNLIPK